MLHSIYSAPLSVRSHAPCLDSRCYDYLSCLRYVLHGNLFFQSDESHSFEWFRKHVRFNSSDGVYLRVTSWLLIVSLMYWCRISINFDVDHCDCRNLVVFNDYARCLFLEGCGECWTYIALCITSNIALYSAFAVDIAATCCFLELHATGIP